MASQTSSGAIEPDLGLYVHVPFCEHVCPYCDFDVIGVRRLAQRDEREFVDLVLREFALARERIAGREVATVYFGGGTPALLSPASIGRLLAAFAAELRFAQAEITVELNPGQLEVARVPAFREAGVTRLSLGVQAFDDEVLRRLGRAQKGREALRGLEACLAAGFPTLSIDLIYGAPGQSLETLLRDVETAIDLGVPHVSAYSLTIEPGTPFALGAERGVLDLPDEDTVLAMSRLLRSRLAAAGIAQYEISSYARPGHRSRHNQRYWLRGDVLGLGPSAATLLGAERWRNARTLAEWRATLEGDRLPIVESRDALRRAGAPRDALPGLAPARRRAPRGLPAPLRRLARGLLRGRARGASRARPDLRRGRRAEAHRARNPLRGRGLLRPARRRRRALTRRSGRR